VINIPYTGPTTEPDEYDLMARELDVTIGPTIIEDEYEDFTEKNSPHAITTAALDWWLEEAQRTKYPRLSQMAIDILSIPAMSAEPERVFSGARRTISWERSQLGASNIMKTECLKSWYRSHITKGRTVAAMELLGRRDDRETEDNQA
jgi:hAT family C-terminal dimerisation region